jgi:UDP-N-acetyl-2-amino-2-deoxyglucuronate dehydrogenase
LGNSSGIRFGIIGAGVAAETHARELRHVPGASLQAVFARNAEKAERFRSTFSIPSAYSDLEPFLRDRTIDIVIVATPNGLHRDYALSVAAAGKHVVVEKPLEMSVPRAEDIILACKNAGRRLFVIYQRRHAEATQQARLDILNGKLGKIILINIIDNQFRHPRYYSESHWRGTREQEGGGCIITQSTHLIDLAQYLLGPIVSVFAYTQTALHSIETEDSAVAVFKFANGAFGTLSSSTAAYPGLRHLITISGTEGSIIINGEHDQIVFRASAHDANFIDYHAGFSFLDPIDPRNYPTFGQRAQLQQIVASLNNTGLRSEPDEYELLQALYVSDALYRSAAEGRSVTISQHLKS